MELFREIFFFFKIHKKTPVLQSHINKVARLYTTILLKERTPTQVDLRDIFYRTLPGDYFCSAEKIFYQQNIKDPSQRRGKIERACKKNNHADKTKT